MIGRHTASLLAGRVAPTDSEDDPECVEILYFRIHDTFTGGQNAHSRLDRFTSLRSRLSDEDDGRERKARRREAVNESSSEAPERPVYEP